LAALTRLKQQQPQRLRRRRRLDLLAMTSMSIHGAEH
jgi:hypothetical protein